MPAGTAWPTDRTLPHVTVWDSGLTVGNWSDTTGDHPILTKSGEPTAMARRLIGDRWPEVEALIAQARAELAESIADAEYKKRAKLVCFGRGGDSVDWGRGCSSSGYGTPERPHAADMANRTDGQHIPDGCPVIDKREARDLVRAAIMGPMVNVDLADDGVDRCPVPSAMMAEALAGNQYGTLVTAQAVHRATSAAPGPLDRVSTAVYVEFWRAAGARIGHYQAGRIVWDA
jgi:hypothetical protein